MLTTDSERIITQINHSIFFNEFTYDKTDFITKDNNRVELADNILWLDGLLIIIQIKERHVGEDNSVTSLNKWFANKVISKAKKQIKSTNDWLKDNDGIDIKNGYNQKSTLHYSDLHTIHNVILYHLNDVIPEGFSPEIKYITRQGLFIHIISSNDYSNLCKLLMTPTEIGDYLSFRADLLQYYPNARFTEQYILSHFFQNPNDLLFNAEYISGLQQICALIQENEFKFSFSSFISNFHKMVIWKETNSCYLPVMRELAKLNRVEMMEYQESFVKIISNEPEGFIAYKSFLCERTSCGFVISRMQADIDTNWQSVLSNITEAFKYRHKCDKCVGVISHKHLAVDELVWMYTESPWEYDAELENICHQLSLHVNSIRVQEPTLLSALKNDNR